MTTITNKNEGNNILQENEDHPNFISDSFKGAYWEPSLPDTDLEGTFVSTFQPGETNNIQWKRIKLDIEYASDETDPDANITIQLVGIDEYLEETHPLSEHIISPVFPFNTSSTIIFNLENNTNSPNLMKIAGTAAAGKIGFVLPRRWKYYLDATLHRNWLENYTKRKPQPITGSTEGIMENYPSIISVAYDSDMNNDFSDIRFTDNDGVSELNHVLINKTDGSAATFRVQKPYLPSSPGVDNIYVYYGNTSAVTASDPYNTYTYYDDFEDGEYGRVYTETNIVREEPYTDWLLRAGTVSMETTTPLSGTNSIKHYGDSSNSVINRLYKSVTDLPRLVSFNFKLTGAGTLTSTPWINLWISRYQDLTNYVALRTYYDFGTNKQKLQFYKVEAGTETNIGIINWMTGKLNTSTTYEFIISDTGTNILIYVNSTLLINTAYTTSISCDYIGFGAISNTQGMWDKIWYYIPPNNVYGSQTIGSIGSEESTTSINVDTVTDEETQSITFTAPADWTPSEPGYLELTDLDDIICETHETLIKPLDIIQVGPHPIGGCQAVRIKTIVTGDDQLLFAVNNVHWVYDYLEDI